MGAHLFIQGTRSDLTEAQFDGALSEVQMSATLRKAAVKCFSEKKPHIRDSLSGFKGSSLTLTDVKWRLDMCVQTRAYKAEGHMQPKYVVQLETESNNDVQD